MPLGFCERVTKIYKEGFSPLQLQAAINAKRLFMRKGLSDSESLDKEQQKLLNWLMLALLPKPKQKKKSHIPSHHSLSVVSTSRKVVDGTPASLLPSSKSDTVNNFKL